MRGARGDASEALPWPSSFTRIALSSASKRTEKGEVIAAIYHDIPHLCDTEITAADLTLPPRAQCCSDPLRLGEQLRLIWLLFVLEIPKLEVTCDTWPGGTKQFAQATARVKIESRQVGRDLMCR